MCLLNANCSLRHPPDVTCAMAAALRRKGFVIVPVSETREAWNAVAAPKPVTPERRAYMAEYMRKYRARKKAETRNK